MIGLNLAEVARLHKKLTAATGGLQRIRDIGLLESAVLGCYQTFVDEELYPTIEEKAARLAYAICKNHPFIFRPALPLGIFLYRSTVNVVLPADCAVA